MKSHDPAHLRKNPVGRLCALARKARIKVTKRSWRLMFEAK